MVACGGSSNAEARALLHHLQGRELEAPLAERQARIGRLEALSLHSDELEAVRDACARAHRRLLEAEVAQAEAKQGLVVAGDLPEGTPSSGLEDLQRSLQRSEAALARAKAAFPDCRDRSRKLVRKYR